MSSVYAMYAVTAVKKVGFKRTPFVSPNDGPATLALSVFKVPAPQLGC